MGGTSLMTLLNDDEPKQKFVKTYFSNYFNVDVIDEFTSNSKQNMDRDWNNILDTAFLKNIEMKSPEDLMNGYFHTMFGKINEKIKEYKQKSK